MDDFLRNGIRFPARPPLLNKKHPFYSNQLVFAAVANISGGMTDLVTGNISTNTATNTEVNELGPCVWGNSINSSTFLSFPFPSAAISFITVSIIFKYIATGQQWLVGFGSTGTGLQVVGSTGIINYTQSGGNIFGNYTLKPNHSYYVVTTMNVGTSGTPKQYMILDMTTGEMFTVTVAPLDTVSGATSVSLLQLNDSNTGAPARIAAAHVSATAATPPLTSSTSVMVPSVGAILESARNPWGLWYG